MNVQSCDLCRSDLNLARSTINDEGEINPIRFKQRVVLKGKAVVINVNLAFAVETEYKDAPKHVCRNCRGLLLKVVLEEAMARLEQLSDSMPQGTGAIARSI